VFTETFLPVEHTTDFLSALDAELKRLTACSLDILSDASYQQPDNTEEHLDVDDEALEDLFTLNDVELTVKYLSPKKKVLKKARFNASQGPRSPLQTLKPNRGGTPFKAIVPLKMSTPSFGETPVELTQPSISSIHLSEFEQPPQSTSTPFNVHMIEKTLERTPGGTPLNKRPSSYSEPLFRFNSNDLSSSFIDSDVSRTLFPPTVDSPLYHKSSNVQAIKDDISCIVDRMKESLSIRQLSSQNDVSMNDTSGFSLREVSGISIAELNSICTSTPKSIMKTSGGNRKLKIPKKVRINESVELITPLKRKRNISSSSSLSSSTTKKSKQRHHSPSYMLLLRLCSNDKDPLSLIG
jgi:hypothetical protein